jgi:hypothetical protein
MATITPTPFVMKNAILTLGADDHQAAVNSAALNPSSSIQTFKGLTPTAVYSEGTHATWTLDLTYAQDWTDPNSLGAYLYDNEGETVAFVLEPVADGAGFSGFVIITPGAAGGSVDGIATSTVTLGVVGKPALTFPTP